MCIDVYHMIDFYVYIGTYVFADVKYFGTFSRYSCALGGDPVSLWQAPWEAQAEFGTSRYATSLAFKEFWAFMGHLTPPSSHYPAVLKANK